jgi:hypothetical protein
MIPSNFSVYAKREGTIPDLTKAAIVIGYCFLVQIALIGAVMLRDRLQGRNQEEEKNRAFV